MHAADTSLSVERAADVAREAADFVLLERDLDVIRRGIEEGRRTFANTLKYVLTTTSANLGNMVSMAAASLFLPFLPLTAGQILLNNFLSDVPAVGLAGDTSIPSSSPAAALEHAVHRPLHGRIRLVQLRVRRLDVRDPAARVRAPVAVFRTAWFVESLLTELVIALVVRTRRPFFRAGPASSYGVDRCADCGRADPAVRTGRIRVWVRAAAGGRIHRALRDNRRIRRDRRSRQALVAPPTRVERARPVSMMFSRFVLARRFFPENRGRHESSGARDLHEGLARLIEVAEEKGYAGHALVNVRLAIIIPPVHRPVRLNRIYATSPTRYIPAGMACDCAEGWICEQHPDQPARHSGCSGPATACRHEACPWWRGPPRLSTLPTGSARRWRSEEAALEKTLMTRGACDVERGPA